MKRSFSLQGLPWSKKAVAEEEGDRDDKKHLCYFVSLLCLLTNHVGHFVRSYGRVAV